jgi:hypothetical protein
MEPVRDEAYEAHLPAVASDYEMERVVIGLGDAKLGREADVRGGRAF